MGGFERSGPPTFFVELRPGWPSPPAEIDMFSHSELSFRFLIHHISLRAAVHARALLDLPSVPAHCHRPRDWHTAGIPVIKHDSDLHVRGDETHCEPSVRNQNPSRAVSLTCILVGDESLLIQCAALLQREGHRLQGIVTSSPAIRSWAKQEGVFCFEPGSDTYTNLEGVECDVLFSIANLRVLPPELLRLPRIAAVNFHDGPLPERAGLNVPTWAIHDGQNEHGITWHLMTAAVDRGDIIAERRFEIAPDETVFDLNLKCYEAAIESFEEVLDRLCRTPLSTRPQIGRGIYHRRDQRPPLAAIMNWTDRAEQLYASVRSLDFGTYANPVAAAKLLTPIGDLLYLRKASLAPDLNGDPGTILEVEGTDLVVATDDFAIRLSGLTDADGNAADFGEHMLGKGVVLPRLSQGVARRLTEVTERLAASEPFWRRQISSYAPTRLPYEKATATNLEERRSRFAESIDGLKAFHVVLQLLEAECTAQDAFVVAFTLFLARLGGAEMVSVGLRDGSLDDTLAGLPPVFAPTVPLQVTCGEAPLIKDAAARAVAALQTVRRRGTYPHDLVLRSPEIEEAPRHAIVLDLVGDQDEAPLVVRISPEGLAEWIYDPSVYDDASIESMLAQFDLTLAQSTDDLERPLSHIDLLGPEDREMVLYEWNDTSRDGDLGACIHELIERQVADNPERWAIRFGSETWTYAELNIRANQVAHALRALGLSRGEYVGVYLERSAWMVASLLGVLKSGAAYVPLDPSFPNDRLAFMVEDAGLAVIVVEDEQVADEFWVTTPVLSLNSLDAERLPVHNPTDGPEPKDLAYVLYTSGSTGRPKGVMVEHRNVVNFFTGMDERVDADEPGVWLAVTSISFDISVLELFWTLARGFTVVIQQDEYAVASTDLTSTSPMAFSLFYFASDEGGESAADKYKLLLDGARFADTHGFEAVWTPERHFHSFGGLYPNPSLAGAALSTITSRISLRAGSCVSPLHHPVRITEEWSVVDVLSGGRVGISFAAGWQPNDFVLRPEAFADRKAHMFEQIEQVKALWRGETLEFEGPHGDLVAVQTLPRPVQAELPVWITAAGNPDTFREAGARGFNVLTHLLGQRIEDLAEKIEIYREARNANGHDPETGRITLMLHTFVGESDEAVRELVREPMKAYLKSSINLIQAAAWSFPTFRQKTTGDNGQFTVEHLSEEALDEVLDFSFERYFETSALFGILDTCARMVEQLKQIGVDEIACLVDYGVETADVLSMLPNLDRLKELANTSPTHSPTIPENIRTYSVTHLQCTPTQAGMLVNDPDALSALQKLDHMLVGGEALSGRLVQRLRDAGVERITNMYGPTETTIWSATHQVSGDTDSVVPIGRPIANTSMYVLDENMQPVPIGVPGELWIGGAGVARGYHKRPELTAERFAEDPFCSGDRIYRTGDLVQYRPDGVLEFLGRTDSQVKLRGFRVELGEIEVALGKHPDVHEAAVLVREDSPGNHRLVGYCTPQNGRVPSREELRAFLSESLPDYMVPTAFVALDAFPMTPNRKLDRKALPEPRQSQTVIPLPTNGAPVTHTLIEKQLLSIWEDVLGVKSMHPESNFFDLGGHSLLAMQVQVRLREAHGHDVRIVDLFRFPTVRALAEHLNESGEEERSDTVNEGADRGARRAALLRRRARPTS